MKKVFTVCGFEGITFIFLDSSMVEHSAVNRVVAGSSPARGVDGLVVKRLRHRPFTAVTGVQIPLESLPIIRAEICRCGSIGRAADL